MHIQNKYGWIKHVDFMAINLFSLVVCFTISLYIKFDTITIIATPTWGSLLLLLCFINVIVTLMTNPYSSILRRPYYDDVINLGFLTAYSFIIVILILYLFKIGALYSRIALIGTFLSYYVLSLILVYARKKLILSGKVQVMNIREHQLVAVINPDRIDYLREGIESIEVREYKIAGYCFPKDDYDEDDVDDVPVIKRRSLVNYVVNNHIDDVLISVEPNQFATSTYRALIQNGVNVQIDIQALVGIPTDCQFINRVGVRTTLNVGPYAMDTNQAFYLMIKRMLDFIIGIVGCVLLIPLIVVIKASYLLSGDTKSIFYTQKRIGQYGKPFELYKFRSMVPDADERLVEMLKIDEYREQWERNQKFDKDPRITPIGRILRKASLDEFPQFINIVKGEMSFVGPRPLIEGELEEHNGLTLYNKVKPGITGWWACNGRSNIDYKDRLALEYYYVRNCSFKLDLLIIFRTAVSVLRREGAQ